MRRKIFFLFLICASLFAASCSGSNSSNSNSPTVQNGVSPNGTNTAPQPINESPNKPGDKNMPAQALTVTAAKVNLTAGGTGEAVIELKVMDGYHINANPPSEPSLKPTEVEIQSANGITAEKPVYPKAINKKFGFSDKPLDVYEKTVAIKVKLRAAGNATKGQQLLNGVLRYQACDNEVCYPPTKLDLMIPVTIN